MVHNFQKEAPKDFLSSALGNQMAPAKAHNSLSDADFEKQHSINMEELCENKVMKSSELSNKYPADPSNIQQTVFKRKQNVNLLKNEDITVKKRRLSKSKKQLITRPSIEEPKAESPKAEKSKARKLKVEEPEIGKSETGEERPSKKRKTRKENSGSKETLVIITESSHVPSSLNIDSELHVEFNNVLTKGDGNSNVHDKVEKLVKQEMNTEIDTSNVKRNKHYSELKEIYGEVYSTLVQDKNIKKSNDRPVAPEKEHATPIKNAEMLVQYSQDTNKQKEGELAINSQDIDQKDTFNAQDINKNNEYSSSENTTSMPDHIQREIEIINEEFPELKKNYRLISRIGRG
ncbi:hypothetical protein G6F56_011813 [Rhizopus delemar]|nr:hypothetical protein G6F56_011813 [Rhizopus delemar]